ncbi:hypothetical protein GF362_07215 [Candidatus Dojkabacteria bacterium]|nr:hypothetical protein [Candidatus Dojkabacteria bacterium]
MPRVIISAGHTDSDPGSSALGLREVDLTRAIARKLIPYLRANGVITLSVPPNLDLARRIDWINGTGYSATLNDISIEIHINDGNKSGFEFWYKGDGANRSQDLAEKVMGSVTEETGLPSQGVKSEHEHEFGSLAFISNTNTVSVILECLYIDNEEDNKKLKNEKEIDKIAKGLSKGILDYLGIEFKNKNMTPTKKTKRTSNRQTRRSPVQNMNTNAQQVLRNSPPRNQQQYSQYLNQNKMQNPRGYKPGSSQMSREQRQQMIIQCYQRILGRNPSPNDLNYFLNIGITQDKLIQRMINSQEHYDMVKTKNKFLSMRNEYEKQRLELIQLREKSKDDKVIINKLTELLKQKNAYINRVKHSPSIPKALEKSEKGETSKKKYKGSFLDRMFHFFSDILG